MPRRRKDEVDGGEEGRSCKLPKPLQRNAANARERSRMRVLSKAFSKLKTTLPWVPPDTKLSKLDTLRLASSYIAHLQQLLDSEDLDSHHPAYIHPINLTWPFSFNGRTLPASEGRNSDSESSSTSSQTKPDVSPSIKC